MNLSLNSNNCLAFWAFVSNFCHTLIISHYGMIVYMECTHDNKKPYVYGYMSSDFIKEQWDGMQYYGGYRQGAEMPDYFCPDCLEDLFE